MKLDTLLTDLEARKIQVNPRYQRSGQIWPARAKSLLVETVLLGMPIPRVLLHDITPPRPPHQSDIIDGQQRCTILLDFRRNLFALTADIDNTANRGKRFRELSPQEQDRFREYRVPVDRYSGITHPEIRQVFRRLNYYTAPLNAAERRHAQFFGALGTFVEHQADVWSSTFERLRAFTPRQLRRKADQQLMAEVIDAMLRGISTPTEKKLRDVYSKYDTAFSSAPNFQRRLDKARSQLDRWAGDLRTNGLLRKHYHFFSLLIALIHAQGGLITIKRDLGEQKPLTADKRVLSALSKLDDAVRRKVTRGRYAPFWKASQAKTNVRENRLVRCQYFFRALTG